MGSSRPVCGTCLMLLFFAPAGLAQWCPMSCPAKRDMQSAGAFLVLRKEEQIKAQRAVEDTQMDLLSNSSAFKPPQARCLGQTVESCWGDMRGELEPPSPQSTVLFTRHQLD